MSDDRHAEQLLQALGDFLAVCILARLKGELPTLEGLPPPLHREQKERPAVFEPIHRKLVEKALPFETPIPATRLIKLAGYKVNSWSREKVTELCTWGDLFRHPRNRGVSLPKAS